MSTANWARFFTQPSNLLFKGNVLKIADMGQSRVLRHGQSAVETRTRGGTDGWCGQRA